MHEPDQEHLALYGVHFNGLTISGLQKRGVLHQVPAIEPTVETGTVRLLGPSHPLT